VSWIWYSISFLVVVLDQWTKQVAEAHLTFGQSRLVTDFFDLTLAYNRGAAFSFLSNSGGWQRWFFAIIALVVSVVISVWIWRLGSRQRVLALGLALILGGAIGNLYDRLALGHVIDFISVHYQHYYWPAFNIADSAITGGAILLIIDMVLEQRNAGGENNV
jgi:signal peptidase II